MKEITEASASVGLLLATAVHKVKADFSQCTDQLIRTREHPPIPQTLNPAAVYQLSQKSAGAYLLDNAKRR